MVTPIPLKVQPPDVEMIGGLFPRKHISILASKAGAGKSLFCTWFCCQASVGGTLFFDREFQAEPRKILYLAGESGGDLFVTRLNHCFDARNYDNITAFSALELIRGNVMPFLNIPSNAQGMWDIISSFKPDVVIFDSLMGFMSCNESDANEMAKLMVTLKSWAEILNCAILCCHHLRKTDKKAQSHEIDQDEVIGSSIIVRSAGVVYTLTGFNDAKYIKCVKSWWKFPEPFGFRLSNAVNGKLAFLPTMNVPEETFSTKRVKIENVLLQGIGSSFDVKELADKYDVGKSTVYAALQRFLTVKMDDGKLYIAGEKEDK